MDYGLTGKRALVLASSRGLGLSVAEALAGEGANVLLCGRSKEKLAAGAAAINEKNHGKAAFTMVDLTDSLKNRRNSVSMLARFTRTWRMVSK